MLITDAKIQSILSAYNDGQEFVSQATASVAAPKYVLVVITALCDGDHLQAALTAIRRFEEQGYALMEDSARQSLHKTEFIISRPLPTHDRSHSKFSEKKTHSPLQFLGHLGRALKGNILGSNRHTVKEV